MVTRKKRSRNGSATKTAIYVGNLFVGYVSGTTFHKSISGSSHILRSPKAICLDKSSIRDATHAGATRVEICDREDGTTYSAIFDTFHKYCFPVLRGAGDQIGLTLDRWSVNDEMSVAERRAIKSNKQRKEWQLSLFTEAELRALES